MIRLLGIVCLAAWFLTARSAVRHGRSAPSITWTALLSSLALAVWAVGQ